MTPPKSSPGASADGGAKALRADARRNRERVLEAAREAFATEGLAVPLDEISRRAGVGAGTVYRHFPTKEALFEAVILHRIQYFVDEARSLRGSEDPGEAFFGFLSRMVTEGATKKDLVDALAGAGIGVDFGGSPVTQELRASVADLLTSAQRVGAVREDVNAADVMALLTGASFAVRHHAGDAGGPERVEAVLFDGLRPSR